MTAIIQSLTGAHIDLLDPRPSWFDLRTVAHALADKNRFCGQSRVLGYSVAEHCLRVSRLFADPMLALFGLLHELDEVFLPDIPGPLKAAPEMGWYRDLCDRHMAAGSARFELPWPWPREVKAAIKAADLVLLATEARDLTVNAAFWLKEVEPLPARIFRMDAESAEMEFLLRFAALRRAAS